MNVFTPIPHPLHLYHSYFHYRPALPLAFTQPHSAACQVSSLPQKVIRCLYWWAVIQLSSFQRRSDGCRMWQTGSWHPHSCFVNYSIWTLSKWILSNYLIMYPITVFFGAAIINAFPFVTEVECQLCTWSQMIQLSRAYCLHVYLFVVQSKH